MTDAATADLRRRGFASLLAVPIATDGRTTAALEIYAARPRSWSRFEVRRARLVGHQLRGAIARLHADQLAG